MEIDNFFVEEEVHAECNKGRVRNSTPKVEETKEEKIENSTQENSF
jgi:hypothetical protein